MDRNKDRTKTGIKLIIIEDGHWVYGTHCTILPSFECLEFPIIEKIFMFVEWKHVCVCLCIYKCANTNTCFK